MTILQGLTLSTLLLSGCVENGVQRSTHTDTFTQTPASHVDVLWVVDDSNSMLEEQQRLADGFEAFAQELELSNVDFRIGVVTTDMDNDNPTRGALRGEPAWLGPDEPDYVGLFQERALVGIEGSGKEQGIEAALAAVTEPMNSSVNDGFLRTDATLLVIFVSDEDDCTDRGELADQPDDACYSLYAHLVPAKDLVDELLEIEVNKRLALGLAKGDTTAPRVIASTITAPEGGCSPQDRNEPGLRYEALAAATGGSQFSICELQYADLMGELGLSVAGLVSTFRLRYQPIEDTLEVAVDEQLVAADPVNGWTLDTENAIIRFDGFYVPPRGSTISVSYNAVPGVKVND